MNDRITDEQVREALAKVSELTRLIHEDTEPSTHLRPHVSDYHDDLADEVDAALATLTAAIEQRDRIIEAADACIPEGSGICDDAPTLESCVSSEHRCTEHDRRRCEKATRYLALRYGEGCSTCSRVSPSQCGHSCDPGASSAWKLRGAR